jgi:nickel/cobalt exporter
VTGLSVLLLGVALGLRHATDADHVVVVSALVQREQGAWRAARIAALWGAGHAVTFLAVGLLIVVAGVRIPAAYEQGAELMVAAMLIGLGGWHLARGNRCAAALTLPVPAAARPVAIGLIHGLAGSAGIALLAASTLQSPTMAVAYLVVAAFGTVLGMVVLTIAMSRTICWTMRGGGRLGHALTAIPAVVSLGLGLSVLARAIMGGNAQ